MYELFLRNLSCNPKNYEVGDPITKWAVAKWANYDVGGGSSYEVDELRSRKKLRSGRILRSGATGMYGREFRFTTRLRVGIFLFSAPDIYHLFQ